MLYVEGLRPLRYVQVIVYVLRGYLHTLRTPRTTRTCVHRRVYASGVCIRIHIMERHIFKVLRVTL